MKKPPLFLAMALAIAATLTSARSAPFVILEGNAIREDGWGNWGSRGLAHGTNIPEGGSFPASIPGITFTANGGGATGLYVHSQAGNFYTAVPLLRSVGTGGLTLTASRDIQAFGAVMENFYSGRATYSMQFFDSAGTSLGTVSTLSIGTGGDPMFLGMVDPQARIRRILLTSSSTHISPSATNNFAIDYPSFTLPIPYEGDFAQRPVSSQLTLQLLPAATYLHQGLNPAVPTPATTDATDDALPGYNSNVCDLLKKFPTYAPGDLLRLERLDPAPAGGAALIPLAAVFTRTPDIADGRTPRRLSSALPAGTAILTAEVSTPDAATPENPAPTTSTSSPTDIPEDFLTGTTTTHVSIPTGARYLMFALASPGASDPVPLRISHIPRQPFLDWVASLGLSGDFAKPTADADGDGLILLQEFAFRKDPTVNDAATLPGGTHYAFSPQPGHPPAGGLLLTFGARLNAGLTYRAEYSSNLKDWTPAADALIAPSLIGPDGDRAIFTTTDPAAAGNPGQRFGRIVITSLPPHP